MRHILAILAAAALAACGVETAGTAATAASLKKQEIEQGKKTMDQMQKNIGQTMDQSQHRGHQAGDAEK
jgi:hypothetical protein